jgi:hypothetical protein
MTGSNMKHRFKMLIFFFSVSLLTGCQQYFLRGVIFTHITIPLTGNINHTPVFQTPIPGQGKMIRITEPITGYGLYTEMYSNAIGDISKQNGIKKVYFADQEIYSILGIWSSSTIHVYGE